MHLWLQAGHSLRYCQGIRVVLVAPALPEVLETPVGPALPAVRGRCGSTPAGWECGSEWNCSAPCDLRPRESDVRHTNTIPECRAHVCGLTLDQLLTHLSGYGLYRRRGLDFSLFNTRAEEREDVAVIQSDAPVRTLTLSPLSPLGPGSP